MVDSYYKVYKTENARKVPLQIIRKLAKEDPIEEEEIKGITVPTLIIWGEEDNLIPVENASYFKRDIVNSEMEIIPEAGHMPQEEKADEVNELISDFVKSVD